MIKLLRTRYPLQQDFIVHCSRCMSENVSTPHQSKPIIPKRIERRPTDILRALSSTVGRDPTAAHYKYHDDPFFIPMSNVGKRTFAMAQEAGRKAAKWIVNENSELFQHKVADPPIEAFIPKVCYNEKSEVGEDTLVKVIGEEQVTDALIIYNLLQDKGITLSASTYQSLLELLSFYNCDETLPEELVEERWFTTGNSTSQERKSWKDHGIVENIFKQLETLPQAYSTLIQGMIKHGQIERAWQLYEAALAKQFVLDVNVYNALVTCSPFLKETPQLRWQQTEELLQAMARQGIAPDISTLNAVLAVILSAANHKVSREWLLGTLAEFKTLGIEPSLGSYYYVLKTLCRERGPISHVLVDIMNELEGKQFEIRHTKDLFFFSTAMEVCQSHLHDVALARRVDNLLHLGSNYDLIGDSLKESLYHRHYFILLIRSEPLDKFMETYNLLVPNIYTPEPAVMMELLQAVDMNGAMEYFPMLWSHMVMFDHSDRINLLNFLLESLVRNQPADGDVLVADYEKIALDVWEKIEKQPATRTNKISWTGDMLSNVLIILTRANNMEKSSVVMHKLDQEQNSLIGEPTVEALCSFLDLCIARNNVKQALICLQYCSELGLAEVASMVKQIQSQMVLSEVQAQKVKNVMEPNKHM